MKNVQRLPAEELYQRELDALIAAQRIADAEPRSLSSLNFLTKSFMI